ncbi:GNAT family N-acetyltransferase [Mesorhizobium sp. IMUNJ 23232]|uniref:GNAT family N-acetyltransferase n=1 Tax=Mesorhizobium sp. IMUNJ 23232 TaxID=3376064 RepID=UPI0037947433
MSFCQGLRDCPSEIRRLRLRVATPADRSRVRAITLGADQELFAGTADSVFDEIASSSNSESHHPFVVECFETKAIVAFLVLREAGAMPSWACENAMTVHALRVDVAVQGRGIGRFAIMAAADWAISTRPSVRQLMLAVNARNRQALIAYLSWGFRDTGLIHDGPIGRQIILAFPLRSPLKRLSKR